jgi:hypothetical protein
MYSLLFSKLGKIIVVFRTANKLHCSFESNYHFSSNKKVLLSQWLGAKQETGIKNQLFIQETKQKNALLSITIQQLDDGAEKGIYSSARTDKKENKIFLIYREIQSGAAKIFPHI